MWIVIQYDTRGVAAVEDRESPSEAESAALTWCQHEVGRRAIVARAAKYLESKLKVESTPANDLQAPASSPQ